MNVDPEEEVAVEISYAEDAYPEDEQL